ncbi:MAG: hypothetical protein IJH12_03175 [Clostridia bacterium]|nr:hypothetical protein [Clostridia bacterium]
MIRLIFVILLIFTISYWFGYHIGQSENDIRPLCFIFFDDASSNKHQSTANVYWGYEGRPVSNHAGMEFLSASINNTDAYFLIEKNFLFQEANGRRIIAIITQGRFSKRNNSNYMSRLCQRGKAILIEDIEDINK